ncbi:MAG TPA: signal recognition particle-docking protein FtsY [Chitinophagales bacterium]|nr:signal recognition particle-docking protein FtsY [Chitinophagales bacterium]HRK27724.1 signal recognition particle-docking protein FtsY [Chitinophagales bacterium]
MSFFGKFFSKETKEDLNKGLQKSNQNIFSRITKAVAGKDVVDEEVLDSIEEALVACDISVETVIKIINRLEQRVARDKYLHAEEVYDMLKDEIINLLTENNTPDYTDFTIPQTAPYPYVMLIVGVNGVGKTTTIGKLAHQFTKRNKKVVLGAADTFRAAAVEQLTIWAERAGVPIIKQGQGADPAAVAYDTVQAAIARQADVALIDTAGRLHNKKHLMEELSKIKRVIQKISPDLPHDVMLILDGSTGQNAIMQAEEFMKATEVTAIAVTKLDGTAKGGAVIGIADKFGIPIKYIGVGEGIDQLQIFNKKEFVDSLFQRS